MRTASKYIKISNSGRKTSKGRRKTRKGGSIGFGSMQDVINQIAEQQVEKEGKSIQKKEREAMAARRKIKSASGRIKKTRHTSANVAVVENDLEQCEQAIKYLKNRRKTLKKRLGMVNMIDNKAIAKGKSGKVDLLELIESLPPDKI
tara:strand:- start:1822 stop:2262 length:441 start_codon:yes stop_codon:yes gene_type:complete